ncbi:MAG: helix-turn-helix domain-containing protein, partial [Sphaerochaetaceae bacterium]|nr:helix-turn-helix domain-containing protein [Sphaerochaetaceae bacterium]
NNLPPKPISSQAMQWLSEQPWKGNVRELKSTIERGVIITKNDHITVVDLHPDNNQAHKHQDNANLNSFHHAQQEFEKAFIINALSKHNGNITQTAKAIEFDKSNLIKKMKKYGIRP